MGCKTDLDLLENMLKEMSKEAEIEAEQHENEYLRTIISKRLDCD